MAKNQLDYKMHRNPGELIIFQESHGELTVTYMYGQ